MNPELVLVRVPLPPATPAQASIRKSCGSPLHFCSNTDFTGIAHWDLNQEYCLAVLRAGGLLVTYVFEKGGGHIAPELVPISAFQVHVSHSNGTSHADPALEAINVQWGGFEFIPGRTNEILFHQVQSSRILFTKLPGATRLQLHHDCKRSAASRMHKVDIDKGRVFCVGRHSAFIVCITVKADGQAMASAAMDGSIRVWRLADGAMLCETNVATLQLKQPFGPNPFRWDGGPGICPLCSEAVQGSWSSARILEFLGESWEIGTGCQDGKVRFWAMRGAQGDNSNNISTDSPWKRSRTLLSTGEREITALAVHCSLREENLSQNAHEALLDPLTSGMKKP